MAYRKEQWGVMPSGEPVSLYTLSNDNGVSASFTDLGGTWVTMYVPDRDGKLVDVVLGYDSVEAYLENPPHFGAPIGRNANRIAGARFKSTGWLRTTERTIYTARRISITAASGRRRQRKGISEPLSAFLCSVPMAIRDTREMPTLR